MRADGFWLHNVLLNGVWELNGFNKQCVEKNIRFENTDL